MQSFTDKNAIGEVLGDFHYWKSPNLPTNTANWNVLNYFTRPFI